MTIDPSTLEASYYRDVVQLQKLVIDLKKRVSVMETSFKKVQDDMTKNNLLTRVEAIEKKVK